MPRTFKISIQLNPERLEAPAGSAKPKRNRPLKKSAEYRKVKKLGSGSYGVVYLLERIDGNNSDPDLPLNLACKRYMLSANNLEKLKKDKQATPDLEKDKQVLPSLEYESNNEYVHAKYHYNSIYKFDVPKSRSNVDNNNDNDAANNKEKDHYLIMEYLPGRTLENYLRPADKTLHKKGLNVLLDFVTIAGLLAMDLEQLHIAHYPGTIHCDIHPTNIMFEDQPRLRVRHVDLNISIENAAPATSPHDWFRLHNDPPGYHWTTPREYYASLEKEDAEGREQFISGTKSDVHMFGVCLLDLLGQKKIINRREALTQIDLTHWDELRRYQFKFNMDLPCFNNDAFAPVELRQLIAHFVARIVQNNEDVIKDYNSRPNSSECLQFFVWMQQLCIMLQNKLENSDEYTITFAKARLLLAGLWEQPGKNSTLSHLCGDIFDFDMPLMSVCKHIVTFPFDKELKVETLNQILSDKGVLTRDKIILKLAASCMNKNYWHQAINDNTLTLKFAKVIANDPLLIKATLQLIMQKDNCLSPKLQKHLVQAPSKELKIHLLIYTRLANTHSHLCYWLQEELLKLASDQNYLFAFNHLNKNEKMKLFSFLHENRENFKFLITTKNYDRIRRDLENNLFTQIDEYINTTDQLVKQKGFGYYRGSFFGTPVGVKCEAAKLLRAAYQTANPALLFQSQAKVRDALFRGELGSLAAPFIETLNTIRAA